MVFLCREVNDSSIGYKRVWNDDNVPQIDSSFMDFNPMVRILPVRVMWGVRMKI